MISIVTVYNDERKLNDILLPSLRAQTAKFELIALDNTKGRFKSAAEALNLGGARARGKYIMFVHQDVELASASWLEGAEASLNGLPQLGVAGVAGMSKVGRNFRARERGYISTSGLAWGAPFSEPQEVQTLDECLIVVPATLFRRLRFDEKTFDGWHCYSVDYCLRAGREGKKCYVIPHPVYHRCSPIRQMLDWKNLRRYQGRLFSKHGGQKIFTTTGEISPLMLLVYSLYPLYLKIFPKLSALLKNELLGCSSVLDMGCGSDSPLQHCNVRFSVGVDASEPSLEESQKRGIHNAYVKADVKDVQFKPKSFDAVIAMELLEHLPKVDGHALMKKMEKIAKKRVIISVPNGDIPTSQLSPSYSAAPPGVLGHVSRWSAPEFREMGYKVRGISGPKPLWRWACVPQLGLPNMLFRAISDMTQKATWFAPGLAAQLFAVKEVGVR